MASGSVLIVDNRGGWRQMVEHGKTGWLCSNERDFIYYASKMACEPNLRDDMAEAALADRCTATNPRSCTAEEIEQIFRKAYSGKLP